MTFDYATPSPHFDRSKVKGLVASLISLDPQNYNKSTALEITAGGRLYNVVVENEGVGKELLQNGRLKKRVTIIPLNKINAFKMSTQVRMRNCADTICSTADAKELLRNSKLQKT